MPESTEALVNGRALVCAHCGNNQFSRRRAQLNTALATFFNVDWLNESADLFVCSDCGQIVWFLNRCGVTTGEEGGRAG